MKPKDKDRSKKKKQQQREIRLSAAPGKFEIRKAADGTRSISGEAIVYNTLSQPLGGFREQISPGAFTQSLRDNPDVLAYYSHDSSKILGRVSSGTLEINDTPTALRFTCKLPDTTWANDVIALASRGDLRSMSFGFSVTPNGDDWQEINGEIIRTVNTAVLYEISVVGDPAYKSSSFNLRSCPKSLRTKIKRDDDDDDLDVCNPDSPDYDPDACDDDDNDEEDRDECRCSCRACSENDDCSSCDDPECLDENCESCAAQTRAAHTRLLLARLRS